MSILFCLFVFPRRIKKLYSELEYQKLFSEKVKFENKLLLHTLVIFSKKI